MWHCFNGSTFIYLIPQMALYYSLLLVATTLEQQWQNLNQTFPNGWYYFSFYMVL
jgi:hypothetical protein